MTRPPVSFSPDGANNDERSELLKLEGPKIPVQLGSPSGNLHVERIGLIDTGATDIIIDMRAAKHLELQPIDLPKQLNGVGGTLEANVYAAEIHIPELKFRKLMQVFAPRNLGMIAPVLLGRPFLQNFIMNYDGRNGVFSFYDALQGYPLAPDDE